MTTTDYNAIQQKFVHKYMDSDDRIHGVRIEKVDGEWRILVDIDFSVDLPDTFEDFPVYMRDSRRTKFAYA